MVQHKASLWGRRHMPHNIQEEDAEDRFQWVPWRSAPWMRPWTPHGANRGVAGMARHVARGTAPGWLEQMVALQRPAWGRRDTGPPPQQQGTALPTVPERVAGPARQSWGRLRKDAPNLMSHLQAGPATP